MSNAFAIAGVTAVLKGVLDQGFKDRNLGNALGGDVTITNLPPDRIPTDAAEPTQLNVFVSEITLNQAYANSPLLGLNLRCLMTAFGAKEFFPEIVLGHAMQVMNETRSLQRTVILNILGALPATVPAAIKTCGLADQTELIKISLSKLTTEEVSKLWTALQAHYRPSAAYDVTVLLIDNTQPPKTALPVTSVQLNASPFNQPRLDKIVAATEPTAPITPSSELIVHGSRLKANSVSVFIGDVDATASIKSSGTEQIRLALPSGLFAGIRSLQIIHQTDGGAMPSNAGAFVLHPQLTAVISRNVVNNTDDHTLRDGELKLNCVPDLGRVQQLVVLLSPSNPGPGSLQVAVSLMSPVGNGFTAAVTQSSSVLVPFKGLVPGDYLVRMQVDGAESLLTSDPVTGQFNNPKITV